MKDSLKKPQKEKKINLQPNKKLQEVTSPVFTVYDVKDKSKKEFLIDLEKIKIAEELI